MEIGDKRFCSKCSEEYSHYGQRMARCRSCKKAYQREYYRANPESRKKLRRWANDHRSRQRKMIAELKESHGCIDCGVSDHRVLDFDHLPEYSKEHTVSKMISSGFSDESVLREVAKCAVRCSNCHRIKTYERLSACGENG